MTIKYEVVSNIVEKASGRWPTTKLAALKESIRKWEFIVSALSRHSNYILDGGVYSCALCQLYPPNRNAASCEGCPVAEYTGKHECVNTPYHDFRASFSSDKIKYAKQEVAFLKKLIPIVKAETKEKSSQKKTGSRK